MYALEYDEFGTHRVRVIKTETGEKTERIGDDPADPGEVAEKFHKGLKLLWSTALDFSARNRRVPVLKEELENVLKSKEIKNLINAGFMEPVMLRLVQGRNAHPALRSCYSMTELGRRHARRLMNEKVSSETQGPGDSGIGSLVGAGEGTDSSPVEG